MSTISAERDNTMFCVHCGKEIAEGSAYCLFCGKDQVLAAQAPADGPADGPAQDIAPDAGASAPKQPDAQGYYAPGGMAAEDNERKVGAHSNAAAWLLSVMPVVRTLALMILIPVNVPLALLVWLLTIGANAALYMMDRRALPGASFRGWGWLAIVLPVVYLYIRAARIDKSFGPAILNTVLLVLCVMTISVWGAV